MCAQDHEVIRCDQSFNQIRCSLTRLYVSVVRCQVQLSVYNVLVLVPWNDLLYLEFVFFQKQTSKINTSKKMTSPTVPLPGDIAMANVKVQCAQWCGQKWSTRVLPMAGFVCREVLNKYYETIWNRILGNSSKMFVFISLFDFASLLLTLVVSIDFHKVSVWGIGILCFKWDEYGMLLDVKDSGGRGCVGCVLMFRRVVVFHDKSHEELGMYRLVKWEVFSWQKRWCPMFPAGIFAHRKLPCPLSTVSVHRSALPWGTLPLHSCPP